MFEFDASKLIIIGIVALIVIGPKDLPRVLRQVGQAVGKMRRMASEFQGQFMEAMREADVADAKAEVEKLAGAKAGKPFDPLGDIRGQLNSAIAAADSPARQIAAPPSSDPAPLDASSIGVSGGEPSAVEPAGAPPSDVAPAATSPQEVDAEMRALADALRLEIDGPAQAGQDVARTVLTPVGLVPVRSEP